MSRKTYPILPDGSRGLAHSEKFYLMGNKVFWDEADSIFKYKDGTKVTRDTLKPCPVCGELPIDDCDPCLGKLPGVKSACCGHGVKPGYVKFNNGIKIEGKFKVTKFEAKREE